MQTTCGEDWLATVQRAQAGDARAFDALVRRFQDRAVGYAYGVLGDFHRAEDAAQDAFVQAFRDLPTLNEPAAFPGWLRRIVLKHCDRATRGGRLPVAPLDAAREAAACAQSDPAAVLERRVDAARVRDALASLAEADRAALALFYIAEHGQDEVAAFLQVTPAAARKRLQRARGRLKERMLEMLQETLRHAAPSRDTRFAEQTALLARVVETLEKDGDVVAAFLCRYGDEEGFGDAGGDAWRSLNVHVVMRDAAPMDVLATGRRAFAARVGTPLLFVEAPQNAPPNGYYLMALYDAGEAGPYEVDWYWHDPATAAVPAGARVLFDRAGLPSSPEPPRFGYLREDEYPAALRRVEAARSPDERRAAEAANVVSLFWAMWLIAARRIARSGGAGDAGVPFSGMLRNLLRDARRLSSRPGGDAPDANDDALPTPAAAAKAARLRELASEMEALQTAITVPDLSPETAARARRFLDLAAGEADGAAAAS